MNRGMDPSGHHLFGLLALQTGLIDQAALVGAFHAWTRDKGRPLADHLVALGYLDEAHRPLLEGLAAALLAHHGGDIERSLAAISTGAARRASLGDLEIDATSGHVACAVTANPGDDADRTIDYARGISTSDGQRFRILRPARARWSGCQQDGTTPAVTYGRTRAVVWAPSSWRSTWN